VHMKIIAFEYAVDTCSVNKKQGMWGTMLKGNMI